MPNLNSIIKEVLYEQKEKSLKVFYTVDVFIQDFPSDDEEEEQPEEPVQAEQPAPAEAPPEGAAPPPEGGVPPEEEQLPLAQSTKETGKKLNEEIYKFDTEGVLTVPAKDAKTILTLNDLLEYIADKKDEEGNQIFNDLVVETIRALTGQQTQKAVQDLLNQGDEMNVTIDYGFDQDDSIGLQVSKNKGVAMATIIMRKDGSPMTGQFNVPVFNQTITGVFLKEIQ